MDTALPPAFWFTALERSKTSPLRVTFEDKDYCQPYEPRRELRSFWPIITSQLHRWEYVTLVNLRERLDMMELETKPPSIPPPDSSAGVSSASTLLTVHRAERCSI